MKNLSKTIMRMGLVLLFAMLLAIQPVQADPHPGQSKNVAMIGGPNVYYGGVFPTTGPAGELGDFAFTTLNVADVNAANLANYDTVLLNVGGSYEMRCNVNKLSASAKTDLVNFVRNGGKLIISDSECTPQDYSWLPYPFTTKNPGAQGAQGTLTITEENILSTSTPGDIHYIDNKSLGSKTDAVGDMNVMTTYDPGWCLDMSGTNVLKVTGPVQTYAKLDAGLMIYNGLDQDYLGRSGDPTNGLRKIWVQQLQSISSLLPCGIKVIGITLTPPTATNTVGTTHTVTAKLTDLLTNPQPGIIVTFNVISGPNTGASGTCSPADCTTDANGVVTFTYTGSGGVGTDEIKACFIDQTGKQLCDKVTKEWIQLPELCPDKYGWGPKPAYEWPDPNTFVGRQIVHFVNKGTGDAYNVKATVCCTPINVVATDPTVTLGNIPAGGSAWSSDTFELRVDMSNPQDPKKGICWQVEYDDAAGGHYVIKDVAKYCGEKCSIICP